MRHLVTLTVIILCSIGFFQLIASGTVTAHDIQTIYISLHGGK